MRSDMELTTYHHHNGGRKFHPLTWLFPQNLQHLRFSILACNRWTWFINTAVIRNRISKYGSLVLELIFFNVLRIKYENDSAFQAQTSKFKQYDNESFNKQPSGSFYWHYALILYIHHVYTPRKGGGYANMHSYCRPWAKNCESVWIDDLFIFMYLINFWGFKIN